MQSEKKGQSDAKFNIKTNNWNGEDVFKEFRSATPSHGELDSHQFGVRIDSPKQHAVVDIVSVEGTYEKIPSDYELRGLRYYPRFNGYVPQGVVAIDRHKRTWKIARFDVGGESGEPRGIEISLAGPNARILLDYWPEAHNAHWPLNEAVKKLTGKFGKWLPPITGWPSDLITCHRIDVTRK